MLTDIMINEYREILSAHKQAVKIAGMRLGIDKFQLAIHDNSKFHEPEFQIYAEYVCGGENNVTEYKEAWLHHIHKNCHHWEHWIIPGTNEAVFMPCKYVLEMVADWMGANEVYEDNTSDLTYWLKNNLSNIILHPYSRAYLNTVLIGLGYSVEEEIDEHRKLYT